MAGIIASNMKSKWDQMTPAPDKKAAAAQKPAAVPASSNAIAASSSPATPASAVVPATAPGTPPATAPATPTATPAAPISPVLSTINPETDTVQGQVASITSKDSPMMELARTRASQGMNQRGLINSSMALQAGEAAVLDAALPMAAADAATYSRNREMNQATQNEFNLKNLGQEHAKLLLDIENKNQTMLQANQSAMQFYGTTQNAIGRILADPDLPQKTKSQLIQHELTLLQNGLAMSGGITEIPALKNVLTFSGGKGMKNIGKVEKLKPPTKAKAGDIFTDENGKKFKFITLRGGITDKGEWKPV